MTLLVVVYENICGIFFFFLNLLSFLLPLSPTLLCVFLLRNKELEEIHDCPKSAALGRGWEGELGKQIFLKSTNARQSMRVVLKLFLSLLLNFVVGFLLSSC